MSTINSTINKYANLQIIGGMLTDCKEWIVFVLWNNGKCQNVFSKVVECNYNFVINLSSIMWLFTGLLNTGLNVLPLIGELLSHKINSNIIISCENI